MISRCKQIVPKPVFTCIIHKTIARTWKSVVIWRQRNVHIVLKWSSCLYGFLQGWCWNFYSENYFQYHISINAGVSMLPKFWLLKIVDNYMVWESITTKRFASQRVKYQMEINARVLSTRSHFTKLFNFKKHF